MADADKNLRLNIEVVADTAPVTATTAAVSTMDAAMEKLEKDARFFGGENTADYYRECRGRWAPAGISKSVMER